MRDPEIRRWRALVRDRANHEWRDLSFDVVDELASHLAELYASAIERGATAEAARRTALEALNAASFVELSKRPRARRGGGYGHDVRVAVRQLVGTPLVTAVAVLSLALGIGANTAIFSLVNSLLLSTLPVRDPGQLVMLSDAAGAKLVSSRGVTDWTNPIWEELRGHADVVDGMFAWAASRFNLSTSGETDFVDGIWASAHMFDVLGVPALLGRTFTDADDRRRGGGAEGPVAVISYAFWQRRFGGAADIVGRRLDIENTPFTIVGVSGPDFFGPEIGHTFDVAVPIGTEPLFRPTRSALDHRAWWWLSIMARLKTGQSIDSATSALRGIQPQLREATLPQDWRPSDLQDYLTEPFVLVPAAAGDSALRRRYERPLWTILAVVALVLLIACANIANLLLARATARRHEWSVRIALGASRWRLVRLLLTESVLLAVLGGAFGFLIALWGSKLLVHQLSTPANTVFLDLSIDWRVLAFTSGVTMATALIFGIAPAFRAAGAAPMDAMKGQGRGTSGESRASVGGALVAAQVALSVVLVVAAGLFVRTFTALTHANLGFDRDRVLLVTMNAERAAVTAANRPVFFERLRQRVAAVPGVASAGVSFVSPVSGESWNNRIVVTGMVDLPERQRTASFNAITPGWLQAYGTALVAGRPIADTDRRNTAPIVLVNQAFAQRFLNGGSPLGHLLTIDPRAAGTEFAQTPREIVGVVADAVYRSVRAAAPPTVYVPLAQYEDKRGPTPSTVQIGVRPVSGNPALLARSVGAAIQTENKDIALTFRTLADQVNASLTQERVVATLAGFFGAMALLLAALGLYGVTSYAVSRRRTEIGIRMALGAAPHSVVRLVLSRVSLLVGVGVLAGAGLSLWASQFVSALLYGLEPHDPATLAGSATVLTVVGAFAGWLPAYRASRIDPAEVLRDG